MKFKAGDSLYYVNPFVFTIEKIVVECAVTDEHNPKLIYYIAEDNAYLAEHDLVETVEEAKRKAMLYLERFWETKLHEIRTYIDASDPDWK